MTKCKFKREQVITGIFLPSAPSRPHQFTSLATDHIIESEGATHDHDNNQPPFNSTDYADTHETNELTSHSIQPAMQTELWRSQRQHKPTA